MAPSAKQQAETEKVSSISSTYIELVAVYERAGGETDCSFDIEPAARGEVPIQNLKSRIAKNPPRDNAWIRH